MNIARSVLGSTKGRLVLGLIALWLVWQAWLTLTAPGKIAADIPRDAEQVNIVVTLPFTPERFHVLFFQRHGRVTGTQDNSVEVRGVSQNDLHAIARRYWVRRVEPLITKGG